MFFSFSKPEELMKTSWRTLGICRKNSWSIPNPIAVEEEGAKVTMKELRGSIAFCKNWKDLVQLVEAYQEVGVSEANIDTGCNKKVIREFAKNVLDVF